MFPTLACIAETASRKSQIWRKHYGGGITRFVRFSLAIKFASAARWHLDLVTVQFDRLKKRRGVDVIEPPSSELQSLLGGCPEEVGPPGKRFEVSTAFSW
jgi:hypothetical protein